jgi:nucleoside-triphosphatase
MQGPLPKNLLLTGSPGCGKTTVVERLADRLADLRLAGFYTAEVRQGGRRVGFEAVGWHGRRAVLARLGAPSCLRVGRYGVDPAALAPLLEDELERPAAAVDLFFLDEIGKMEVASRRFCEAVGRVLDGPVPVVATVALRGGGLIAAVKARPDVRLVTVTQENREQLPEELEAWVRGRTSDPQGGSST